MIRVVDTALYQWDTGRYVTTDIEADHIHFSNKGDSKAVIMELADSKAKIPDYLLQTGKQLCVYVVRNGITVESNVFSVNQRERPENYVYDEDQRNFVYALIADVQAATEAANQAAAVAAQAGQNAGESANRANAAAEAAEKASDDANKAAVSASQAAKSLMVVGKEEGTVIHLDDAIDQYLVGLRVFGKTTQNGTPTPDAPIDIVSLGADGTVDVTINGVNLFNLNSGIISGTSRKVTFINNGFVLDASSADTRICKFKCNLKKGHTYFLSYDTKILSGTGDVKPFIPKIEQYLVVNKPFIPEADADEIGLYVNGASVPTVAEVTNIQVSLGNEKKDYAPFKEQSATIATPNGLPGIPVASGGNYTDANGQQWICDEIDFARGVYVKRCVKLSADQLIPFHYVELTNCARLGCNLSLKSVNYANGLSTHLPLISNYTMDTPHFYSEGSALWIFAPISELTERSKEGATAWAKTIGIEFVYALATPIETPLSEEELAAYAALHTYKNNTTVFNDAGAWMELE